MAGRQIRRGTAAERVALGGLAAGEFGLEIDTRKLYLGSSMGDQVIRGDYITPEMYGAKGNGIADDTTAVQACVNACLLDPTRPTTMGITGRYRLTAPMNIDRLVDTCLQTGWFRIVAFGKNGGFYVDTAIDMFSSTYVNALAPVSEGVSFEGVVFESGNPDHAAHVLHGIKFLRMKFDNCLFFGIKAAVSAINTQSIHFNNCVGKFWNGIFFETATATDNFFDSCLFEEGEDLWKVAGTATGCRFKNNLVENSLQTIDFGFSGGVDVSGNYSEGNACVGPQMDFGGSAGVNLSGNLFSLTAAQRADGAYYAVNWGVLQGASSRGNLCVGKLYNPALLLGAGAGSFDFSGDYDDSNIGPQTSHVHTSAVWGERISIANDTAYSFALDGNFTFLVLTTVHGTESGIIYVRPLAPEILAISLPVASTIELTTGILTGTTGTQYKITVSCHTDGKVYIENRLGGLQFFGVLCLGSNL